MTQQKKVVIIAGPNGAGKQSVSDIFQAPMVSRLPDADMQAVPAALARAAQSARELSFRTGTPLVLGIRGQLLWLAVQASDVRAATKPHQLDDVSF